MFRKKSDNQDSKTVGKLSTSINMISEETELTGNIKTGNSIRIAGIVQGSVEVDGKCILAGSAIVKGDIIAIDADISGSVSGDINVVNKLILRQSAQVFGNIQARSIALEEGAVFEGTCTMRTKNPKTDNEYEFSLSSPYITKA